MGNCDSREVAEQKEKDKKINAELATAKKDEETVIKLLLLGNAFSRLKENYKRVYDNRK